MIVKLCFDPDRVEGNKTLFVEGTHLGDAACRFQKWAVEKGLTAEEALAVFQMSEYNISTQALISGLEKINNMPLVPEYLDKRK